MIRLRSKTPAALMALAVSIAAVGCSEGPAPAPAKTGTSDTTDPTSEEASEADATGDARVDPTSRPNVLLVSIDSLRADHLGCYGYERDTSPVLDALAEEGVLFEQAMSSSSWTLPAHATMFTGLPSSTHVLTDSEHGVLSASLPTLAEHMRAGGYRTAAFWRAPFLEPSFGLDRGFDVYVDCANVNKRGEKSKARNDVSGGTTVDRVAAWLDEDGAEPFFLFVHLWDVHYDYLPPEPYDSLFDPDYEGKADGRVSRLNSKRFGERDVEHVVALYDGEIAWTDHNIGRLIEELDARGHLANTLVIITSDHGEEFYEHGEFGHRKALFEESIAVPLILVQRGELPTGLRIAEPVGLVDLAPTILHAAGLDPMPGAFGRPLQEFVRAPETPAADRPVVAELTTHLAVRGQDWKVLLDVEDDRLIGLWNLADDPGEEHNLLETNATLPDDIARAVDRARTRLTETASELRPSDDEGRAPLPEGLEENLRDLGYVGGDE